MKILLFTTTQNGLSQRAYLELVERGHTVSINLAQTDAAMEAAAACFEPQLIIAPFLKKAIPTSILEQYAVLTLRPDVSVNRGSFSSNGTIADDCQNWRITLFDNTKNKDAATINWITYAVKMRPDNKGNYYQHQLTQAAVQDIIKAVEKFELRSLIPNSLSFSASLLKGRLHSTAP